MYDPMLRDIDEVFKKFSAFESFRYAVYKRAAECVVEEEYHSDDEIHAVIRNQIKSADFSDNRKEAFAAAITSAVAKCRDEPKKIKK